MDGRDATYTNNEVLVGNLPCNASQQEVEDWVKDLMADTPFGRAGNREAKEDCFGVRCRRDVSMHIKRYAFVEFDIARSAFVFLRKAAAAEFRGRRVNAHPAVAQKP